MRQPFIRKFNGKMVNNESSSSNCKVYLFLFHSTVNDEASCGPGLRKEKKM
jgi:hypothetical protein